MNLEDAERILDKLDPATQKAEIKAYMAFINMVALQRDKMAKLYLKSSINEEKLNKCKNINKRLLKIILPIINTGSDCKRTELALKNKSKIEWIQREMKEIK